MTWTAEELKKISDELPPGAAKTLAAQLGVSYSTVRNNLKGRSANDYIILAAAEMALAHQQKILNTKKALSATAA